MRKVHVKQLRGHKMFNVKLCEVRRNSVVGLPYIRMSSKPANQGECRGSRSHSAIQPCLWGQTGSWTILDRMMTQQIFYSQNFISTWIVCRSGHFTKLVSKILCRSGQPTRRVMLVKQHSKNNSENSTAVLPLRN